MICGESVMRPRGALCGCCEKGRLMDTMKKFYIFRETILDNQINDKLAVRSNVIFETVVQKDPHTTFATRESSPRLSRSRALSVDAQTTTATAPPRARYLQPPHAAVHHDTVLRIETTTRGPRKKVRSHISKYK